MTLQDVIFEALKGTTGGRKRWEIRHRVGSGSVSRRATPAASPRYAFNWEGSLRQPLELVLYYSPSSAGNAIENVLALDLLSFINPKQQERAL